MLCIWRNKYCIVLYCIVLYCRRRIGRETIREQVARRRWTWLGHVLRMFYHSHPRIAFTWVPKGERKGSHPRETWRRKVKRELNDSRLRTRAERASAADDRRVWKKREHSPSLH